MKTIFVIYGIIGIPVGFDIYCQS